MCVRASEEEQQQQQQQQAGPDLLLVVDVRPSLQALIQTMLVSFLHCDTAKGVLLETGVDAYQTQHRAPAGDRGALGGCKHTALGGCKHTHLPLARLCA